MEKYKRLFWKDVHVLFPLEKLMEQIGSSAWSEMDVDPDSYAFYS